MATRVALLIGCPGIRGRDGYLKGVTNDIERYADFMQTPAGGAWAGSEIWTLMNPNYRAVTNAVASLAACDYSVVLFSGHGRMERRGNTSILGLIANEEINMVELDTRSARQLLILDACRSYPTPTLQGIYKSAILEATDRDLHMARQLFDQHLMRCEKGAIVMYACAANEAAGENGNGGYFSQSLISAAEEWSCVNDNFNILPVNVAFELGVQYMHNNYFAPGQNPEIYNGRRNASFPFAIKF